MTLEEIEARWKAATPGPWTFDAGRGGIASGVIDVINTDDGLVSISDEDAKAIAAAPTDIAYLLDRVREFGNELAECGRRESVERALAHVRSARIHELEDRVRELASDNRSLRERLNDERNSHNESLTRMHDELARYKRAHAWLVENTELAGRPSEGGDGRCVCGVMEGYGPEYRVPHEDGCEWVKAKQLRI